MPGTYDYMLQDLLQGEESRQQLEEQIRRMLAAQEERPEASPLGFMRGAPGWLTGMIPSDEEPGLGPKEEDPLHARAQEKINAAVAQKESAKQSAEAEIAETKRMQDDAMQRSLDPMSWAQQTDASPLGPEEKLKKIAAEAKAMGGGKGISVPGGSFSQMENSPELQARLRDRDAWAEDQPMRDLEFAMTPDQQRRDPDYAKSAAQSLAGLKEAQAIERRQQIQEMFVNKLGGSGGTVPRDQANQLLALGVNVPYGAIGSGQDEGIAFFDSAIASAGEGLQRLDPMMLGPDHPRIQFERYGAMRASDYKRKIAAGMNPDDAMKRFRSEMAEFAMAFGLMNVGQGVEPQPAAE